MRPKRTYQEKTAADNKSIGFDYQYYYFMYLLLGLKRGEEIGVEVKDDVHLELPSGKQKLIQLKHSVQTSAAGEIKNLTERDPDLWKTLFNWVNVVNDANDGRGTEDTQLAFIDRTEFIIVTNKSESSSNKFVVNHNKFKLEKNLAVFRRYLDKLYTDSKSRGKKKDEKENEVKTYINLVKSQTDAWLSTFLMNLTIVHSEDDLILKIKQRFEDMLFPTARIDAVFHSLDSSLRTDRYLEVKQGTKTTLSYDEFRAKYKACFEIGRSSSLPIRRSEPALPSNLQDQPFIKQLCDIRDIEEDDDELIIEYTRQKLLTLNNLEQWIQDGDLTSDQRVQFDNDSKAKWTNIHRAEHRESKQAEKNAQLLLEEREKIYTVNAIKCLDRVRAVDLRLSETDLGVELSNGHFYLLSDKLELGWTWRWEERYKRDE